MRGGRGVEHAPAQRIPHRGRHAFRMWPRETVDRVDLARPCRILDAGRTRRASVSEHEDAIARRPTVGIDDEGSNELPVVVRGEVGA